jgi:cell division protein WhiA
VSFTTAVREELAHTEPGRSCCRLAEASALMRTGGQLLLRGGGSGVGHELDTPVGAVARRLRATLQEVLDLQPEVEVHQPSGLRATVRYRVRLDGQPQALEALGLTDGEGRPRPGVASELLRRSCDEVAYVRGALMGAGSVSDPRQPPHLELLAPGERTASDLARLLRRCGGPGARSSAHGDGWRVVVKSGRAIGAVLARVGAHTAFLAWDGERLRRELRAEANRAANADRANLQRTVTASGRHVEVIQRAIAQPTWSEVPDDLRAVALARLANPEASLAELGRLLDPPVGKATVHRRLERLLARLAGEAAS